MKQIMLEGGARVGIFSKPPAGFNPLNASLSELRRYGFPALPDNPKQLQRYAEVFARIRDKLHFVEPTFALRKPAKITAPSALGARSNQKRVGPIGDRGPVGGSLHGSGSGGRGSYEYEDWSGAFVVAPQGQSIRCVTAEMLVPDVSFPSDAPGASATKVGYVMWAGIGGHDSGSTAQAGVGADVTPGSKSFYAWYQWADAMSGSVQTLPSFVVNAGDTVLLLITTTGAGATEADLFMVNETSGAALPFTFHPPVDANNNPIVTLVGDAAEWVLERPAFPGFTPPFGYLAPYGTAKFWGCQATSASPDGSTRELLDAGAGIPMMMEEVSTQTVLSCGILTGNQEVVECVFEATGSGKN